MTLNARHFPKGHSASQEPGEGGNEVRKGPKVDAGAKTLWGNDSFRLTPFYAHHRHQTHSRRVLRANRSTHRKSHRGWWRCCRRRGWYWYHSVPFHFPRFLVEPGRVTLIWSTRDEAFASYLSRAGGLQLSQTRTSPSTSTSRKGRIWGTEEESEFDGRKTSADDRRKRGVPREWVAGNLAGLRDSRRLEADNGLLGNLVTGFLFSMYLFASFMVTFEFWVKHQDKRLHGRALMLSGCLGMAVVLGFILNSKVIQRLVWEIVRFRKGKELGSGRAAVTTVTTQWELSCRMEGEEEEAGES